MSDEPVFARRLKLLADHIEAGYHVSREVTVNLLRRAASAEVARETAPTEGEAARGDSGCDNGVVQPAPTEPRESCGCLHCNTEEPVPDSHSRLFHDRPPNKEQLERVGRMATELEGGEQHWDSDEDCAESLRVLLAAYEQAEARLNAIREGKPYPDCWGDCGRIHKGGGGYCCDGLWDAWNRIKRAETERDTAQASEARLREALRETRAYIGALGSLDPVDVQHITETLDRALASTPNPEEERADG